ncbi:MAG TPA: glycosyltransferase family A protein [Myxococcaceae bacterium]|jgi:glycosyltransferase involved in cell wall biosynthesis
MQVTVGIPFFNARSTLGAAMASVLNQTFEDWELILVDDGSTDGSREVAREGLGDPRVRLLSDGANRGLVARLNQIAAAARAPLLARMDADDVMHPDRLRLQVELVRRTGAELVGSGAWVMDERLRVTGMRRPAPFRSRAEVLRQGGFVHPSCLGQTRWFRDHPYDGAFARAEDLELWARTVERSRFAFLDEPLLFYREPRRPNLAAFRASWRTERRIVRLYGPGALSAVEVAARTILTHVKALAYGLASPFPTATSALIARRSSPISEEERAGAEATLARAVARPAVAGA